MFGDRGYELTDRYMIYRQPVEVAQAQREREAIEAIPGVTAVAYGRPVPSVRDVLPTASVQHPDSPTETIDVIIGAAEQEYIDLLGLTVLHGRVPEVVSDDWQHVLVNQTLARAFWGRDDVVGEFFPPGSLLGDGVEVVGVLKDVAFYHPAAPVSPMAWRVPGFPGRAIIETQLTAAGLQQELNRVIEAGAIEAFTDSVESLRALYNELTAPDRARGFLTMAAAALVVLLTIFGYYGTQRYLVAAGRREYAIRAAIGAGPKAISRLVVWRAMSLGLPGLTAGGLLSFVVVTWLRDDFLSPDISPALVTGSLIAGLLLLLLAATLGPAREAKRTQPAPLLRED
jgi:hypothetical protein